MWDGKKPKWKLADITREQIGLIAIYRLAHAVNEMLADSEIVRRQLTKTDERD